MRDTKIDKTAIKPCPYCGGEGHLVRLKDSWYVSCERCHYFYPRETPEDAIDAWNELEVNNEG